MTASALGVIAIALFGAIIGSFLNVVIYRLPRGLSIAQPLWSFCPHCESRIRPKHNVPIFGWLLLRGRCADCGNPVSAMYPAIEAVTALVFLLVWDVLFVSGRFGATIGPASDWPLLFAWLTAFACLIAIAAMDIESYMIDVRPLYLAMLIGAFGHALWWFLRDGAIAAPFLTGADDSAGFSPVLLPRDLPRNSVDVLPPAISLCAAAGGGTWALTALAVRLIRGPAKEAAPDQDSVEGMPNGQADDSTIRDGAGGPANAIPIVLLTIVVALSGITQFADAMDWTTFVVSARWRGILGCVGLMAVIVAASLDHREADHQIIEEIEAERPQARRTALTEFAHFLPALVVGIGLLIYFKQSGRLDVPLAPLIGADGNAPWIAPLGGLLYSVGGMVLGAGIGWAVRIGGTLAFGKEAFGSGDIYILAAIGAALGFWAAFFSFFLSVFLALAGVLLTMFSKRSRAVPFGPWLALGAVVFLWIGPTLMDYFSPAGYALWAALCGS